MTQIIKLTDNIYNRLASLAEGFDTPANLIERILNYYEVNHSLDLPTANSPEFRNKYLSGRHSVTRDN
jgi:hypothetical protein